MAKTLISSPSFTTTPLRHGFHALPHRRLISTRVNFSLNELPPIESLHSSVDLSAIVSRTERLLYTLADAAVAVDSAAGGAVAGDAAPQKSGGWFGFISEAMEVVLKVILYLIFSFITVLPREHAKIFLYLIFSFTLLYNGFTVRTRENKYFVLVVCTNF